jgi:hypothetical protein
MKKKKLDNERLIKRLNDAVKIKWEAETTRNVDKNRVGKDWNVSKKDLRRFLKILWKKFKKEEKNGK